jgi:hypothetical protein
VRILQETHPPDVDGAYAYGVWVFSPELQPLREISVVNEGGIRPRATSMERQIVWFAGLSVAQIDYTAGDPIRRRNLAPERKTWRMSATTAASLGLLKRILRRKRPSTSR